MLRELHRGQDAQGSAALAVMKVALMGAKALGVDGGNMYLQRRHIRQAADAGALAGAEVLALGGSAEQVIAAANEYAIDRNNAGSADVVVNRVDQTVTVTARKSSSTLFAGVAGHASFQTAARATASHFPVGSVLEGVFSIAVDWQEFTYDEPYDLYAGDGPGNFGWLSWAGYQSSECLCESLAPPGNSQTYVNPYDSSDHDLSVGDWVQGSTAVANAACVRDRLDALIADQTPIIIPVREQAQGSGSGYEYQIVGFAESALEAYRLPHENRIAGRFVREVELGGSLAGGSRYGVYRVVLTE